jgi:hypothetical protein
MRAAEKPIIEGSVSKEIRRLIADAIATRSMIQVLDCVAKVRAVYPNSGLSKRQITDEIMTAASAAGVAVAFRPTRSQEHQEGRPQPESA